MSALTSSLYVGVVTHRRLRPKRHALRYRTYALLLDLDELPAADRVLRFFSHNRFNIFSLHDRDYGSGEGKPLREAVEGWMRAAGLEPDGGAIRLLTMPRILGYAFNPLSLYFCHARDGGLKAILYEVNNTFGQRHSYFLPVEPGDGAVVRQNCAKHFYVSPFMGMDMTYEFIVAPPGEKVSITVVERDGAGVILTATQAQSRIGLSDRALARVFFSHPLLTLKVIAGIHFEAMLLWAKGLRLQARPPAPDQPVTIQTIGARSTSRQQGDGEMTLQPGAGWPRAADDSPNADRAGVAGFALKQILSFIDRGRVTIVMPSGAAIDHVGARPGPRAELRLNRWRALRRLAMQGDVGFAMSYVDGDWSSPDLAALIEFAAVNDPTFVKAVGGSAPFRLLNWLAHRTRSNTRAGSRRNVQAHYDLGNDFYRLWLDAKMIYSSAIYEPPHATLEEAQERKLQRIVDRLRLGEGESVLELGCGWGALAARIAATGASVTGVTLSPAQLERAHALARDEALENRLDLRLEDYRDVQGRFDRIVSVEMIEAVGREYLPRYFDLIRQRLKPGGLCVLQAITIAEERFADYCRRPDFIQRYIFPGGFLPSKTLLRETLERAGLRLASIETFGDSYALTLREWRRRFLGAWPEIEKLGFPPSFRRLWEYYLCYCEAGFRAGAIDVGLYGVVHAEGAEINAA